MSDLIDRAALMEHIETEGIKYGVTVSNRCTFRDIARTATTVEPPVVHAYWKRLLSKGCRNPDFVCSACDKMQMHVTNYCPNCGAKMAQDAQQGGEVDQ